MDWRNSTHINLIIWSGHVESALAQQGIIMDHNKAIVAVKTAIGLGIIGSIYDENGNMIPVEWERVINSVYNALRHPDFVQAVKQVAIEAATQPKPKRDGQPESDPIIGTAAVFGDSNAQIYLDIKTDKPYYILCGGRVGLILDGGSYANVAEMITKYHARKIAE